MIKKPKAAFAGFGEVNTPRDIIIRKCDAAASNLISCGVSLQTVYPITDDPDGNDIKNAVDRLKSCDFDVLVLCIAGWIPTHAVIKAAEEFRHLPMVLWGLCGWYENDGRLITTADQAGTTALRQTLADMGYTFIYVYDIAGLPSNAPEVADYCTAAAAAKTLRRTKAGMMGYRDMNLYGTLYDGTSLKRATGVEIETFEMLETEQRCAKVTAGEKAGIIENHIKKWRFIKPAEQDTLDKAAGYYIALRDIVRERSYGAVSLKDVDGMKKLLNFPPAPVFMLLADIDGICVVPENDSLGCVTQLIIKALTGQCGCYLEFYEFFSDRVLAGVPDFVPGEVVDGDICVMPAAFGGLAQGILNISKIKEGELTMCRLVYTGGRYYMHMVKGKGIQPRRWEEAGWTQPAPQLPGLEILIGDVGSFAQKAAAQHYFISYGDNTRLIRSLCSILGIEVY
jgi:L-fucose isomerase-like protein